jgi:hypothetical protein
VTAALSTERVGIDRLAFAAGMYTLAENACRQISEDTIAVFYRQLRDDMTTSEWQAVVVRALEETTGRNPWNTVGDLKRYLCAIRAERHVATDRPPEDELRALEAQADAEAGRSAA